MRVSDRSAAYRQASFLHMPAHTVTAFVASTLFTNYHEILTSVSESIHNGQLHYSQHSTRRQCCALVTRAPWPGISDGHTKHSAKQPSATTSSLSSAAGMAFCVRIMALVVHLSEISDLVHGVAPWQACSEIVAAFEIPDSSHVTMTVLWLNQGVGENSTKLNSM